MDQEKIGKFIAQKRKERGLTQRELGEQLGIGDKAVSKWECGRGMPDNSIMVQLCDLLGISVNELLSGEALSANEYSERAEDNMISLIKEKELLKRNGIIHSVVASICTILLIVVLIGYINVSVKNNGGGAWSFIDFPSLIMDFAVVLVMLLATGNFKNFLGAFWLVRRGEHDADRVYASLQAVKLAMSSFLLGGGFITILDFAMLLSLSDEPYPFRYPASVALLTLAYGFLFAILLLPVKTRLEAQLGR